MYRLLFCALLLNLLGTSTHLRATSSLGPLSEYIQPEDDGTWRVVDDGTSALLENSQSEGAIIYYYVGSTENEQGSRTISVDVGFGQSNQWSSAGLLYGYRDSPRTYYMFTVRGDSTINVHQMADGNFQELLSVSLNSLSAEKTTLTIEENGTSVTLKVNEQMLDSFTDAQLGKGAVGIVAGDIGQYKFSNFKLTTQQTIQTPKSSLNGGDIMPKPDSNVLSNTDVDTSTNTLQEQTSSPVVPGSREAGANTASGSSVEPKKYFAAKDQRFNGMASNYTP